MKLLKRVIRRCQFIAKGQEMVTVYCSIIHNKEMGIKNYRNKFLQITEIFSSFQLSITGLDLEVDEDLSTDIFIMWAYFIFITI